jgi:general secretion pathway protein G
VSLKFLTQKEKQQMKLNFKFWNQAKKAVANTAGFTLVEMMIVIAVLALIMGIVGTNVMGRFNKAKVESTKLQMKQMATVLDNFRRDCGFYPLTDQGLEALVKKPAGRECKNYDPEGYVTGGKLPKDGFGNDFAYTSDGNKFTVISYGNDGKEGGEGLNADITSDQAD